MTEEAKYNTDTFTTNAGVVILSYPDGISMEDSEDLKEFFRLEMGVIRRSAKKSKNSEMKMDEQIKWQTEKPTVPCVFIVRDKRATSAEDYSQVFYAQYEPHPEEDSEYLAVFDHNDNELDWNDDFSELDEYLILQKLTESEE